MSDLKAFVNKYTSTASVCRVTTIEEFNRDGAYMVALKEIYYDVLAESIDLRTPQLIDEQALIMAFMQKENIRLRRKHWPNS